MSDYDASYGQDSAVIHDGPVGKSMDNPVDNSGGEGGGLMEDNEADYNAAQNQGGTAGAGLLFSGNEAGQTVSGLTEDAAALVGK